MFDDATGYDLSDPKHPDFHDTYSMIWDGREKVIAPVCGPNGCSTDSLPFCDCTCDADCECKSVSE